MSMKKKIEEALQACGMECAYDVAKSWLNKTYGKGNGITDHHFYKVRSELRRTTNRVEVKPNDVSENFMKEAVMKVSQDLTDFAEEEVVPVTLGELKEVAKFCKTHGGVKKIKKIVECLSELA